MQYAVLAMKSETDKCSSSILGSLLKNILVSLVLGLSVIFLLLWLVLQRNSDFLILDGLYGQAEEIVAALNFDREGQASLNMHEPMQTAYDAFFNNLKYRILDPEGSLLLSSEPDTGPLLPEGTGRLSDSPEYFTLGAGDRILHVANFRFDKQGRDLIVQTARSDRFSELAREAIMPAVFETATVIALCGFAVFMVAIFMAVRNVTEKIRRISAQAERIDLNSMSSRLNKQGVPSELFHLVNAFNNVLDRLEAAYVSQQRFVANAAHEMKTPLTIIRGQVELHVEDTLRDRLLVDIDAMARTVRQILHLYQVQDIRNYNFATVDIRTIAEDVVETFAHHPEIARKPIRIDGLASCCMDVDRASVFAALRNLVDNAIKFTDTDADVIVSVTEYGFAVEDSGPGFDPETRQHMFERFWRGNKSTTDGSGLGLSIVAEVARIHGGEVVASNAQNGTGATVTLILQ